MTRRARRWLYVLPAMVVFYLGSYAMLSWQGTWSTGRSPAGFTMNVLWQPYGIEANPTDHASTYVVQRNGQLIAVVTVRPHTRNFLGYVYAPMLSLDRMVWHNTDHYYNQFVGWP